MRDGCAIATAADDMGADADRARLGRDMGDHDLGRAAGEAGRVVMLGIPDAGVSQPLGNLGELDRVS